MYLASCIRSRWARIYPRFFGADSEYVVATMMIMTLIEHHLDAVSLSHARRRQPHLLTRSLESPSRSTCRASRECVLKTCGVLHRPAHDQETSRDMINVEVCSITRCLREPCVSIAPYLSVSAWMILDQVSRQADMHYSKPRSRE